MLDSLVEALASLAPMAAVLIFFQTAVLRRPLKNKAHLLAGAIATAAGMWMIVAGMEMGLYGVGTQMADQLSRPSMSAWAALLPFLIGYAVTMAEPSLVAVADKAEDVTGGWMRAFALKNIVSLGVGFGLALGVHRINSGGELWIYIAVGHSIIVVLTKLAPRETTPIAYDSATVTTSTVTVPVILALGVGLAKAKPGVDMLKEGFGLIAIASMFPILFILLYTSIARFAFNIKTGRR